jgi:hypothetical protein
VTTHTNRYWGTFELDDATGLPVLPAGQFWRVSKSVGSSYVDVQRREKRRWGSRPVGKQHPVQKNEATPEEILEAAEYILWKEVQSPDADYRKVLGDYPPKRLEES